MTDFVLSKNIEIEPLEIVKKIINYKSLDNVVLDIGSGTGRNAIYLARHGYQVTAVDSNKKSVYELKKYVEGNDLSIETEVISLQNTTLKFAQYRIILFLFILHYLTKSKGEGILSVAMQSAKIGDLHVMGVITTKGDFYEIATRENNFYLKPGELRDLYTLKGWEILESYEEVRKMVAKRKDGSPMENLVSFLVAKKS